MAASSRHLVPAVASASPATWRHWLVDLTTAGKERLAKLGLALVLGFVLGVGVLFLFAKLADEVMEQETLQLDHAVLAGLQQLKSPAADSVAFFFSALGAELLVVLLIGIVAWLLWKHRFGAIVALLVVTGGAQLLNNVLKDLFERTRPAPVSAIIPAQAFSFPSGHAMVSAAFYLFLAYLGWRVVQGSWRGWWVAAMATIILLIGLSRLYLGVHYFTDVVAGYLAGFVWTDAVIIGGHFLERRRGGRPAGKRPSLAADSG
ncbi:MAG: phosphatase PAP2 family protein [Chloroflexi bacterium]|nr:phosphatase PAP2 family protein [Chloroflexota bacterium]